MAFFSFKLQFDDKAHSLTAEKGIPFDKLSELLGSLYDAIDPKDGTICTLSEIRGNCYAVVFKSESERFHSNFKIVHSRVHDESLVALTNAEKKYAKKLRVVLGDKYYVNAIDNAGERIAHIVAGDIGKDPEHYYTTANVRGVVSEIGGKSLSARPHILVDGIPYSVYTTAEQDAQLKDLYRKSSLVFRVRQKRSVNSKRIVSADLISFRLVTPGLLTENLKKIGPAIRQWLGDGSNDHDLKEVLDA